MNFRELSCPYKATMMASNDITQDTLKGGSDSLDERRPFSVGEQSPD